MAHHLWPDFQYAPSLAQLNLIVADMAAAIAFFRRLGLEIDDTHPFSRHDAFWGARYAAIEDPDRNAVGIMRPVDPAWKKAPPKI
jgi:predicted enzyme related to lactoylglutathione lyase